MKKIDLNEQMYGVAEMPPSVRASKQHDKASQHGAQPGASSEHKKEKVKRRHSKDAAGLVSGGGTSNKVPPPPPDIRRKKAPVRPYSKSCYQTESEDLSQLAPAPPQAKHTPDVVSSLPPPPSPTLKSNSCSDRSDYLHTTSSSKALHQTAEESNTSGLKQKKVKRKKRKDSLSYSSNMDGSLVGGVSGIHVGGSENEFAQFTKPRPEALSLSTTTAIPANTSSSDVSDSGDVRHMLHELLNPTPLSLVTPIPTPSKGHPFTFPVPVSPSLLIIIN